MSDAINILYLYLAVSCVPVLIGTAGAFAAYRYGYKQGSEDRGVYTAQQVLKSIERVVERPEGITINGKRVALIDDEGNHE